MNVRTRFAPSPTGFLHIGGVRTAMYAYAMAKHNGGQFVLRIEDTDQERSDDKYLAEIYEVLDVYGITPDESDNHGGSFGPYTQSKRLNLYQDYVKQLIERGGAYYCFLNETEEEELRAQFKAAMRPFRSPHRDLTSQQVQQYLESGAKYVIRQRMPENRIVEFTDGVQGSMKFNTDDVDEGVLLKSDGFPTYHLAMLVDDHLMEISHVFRGVEWMASIPKHVLLYETMGWEMPQMCHLSVILDPDGGKLSKRRGNTAAMEFIREGYLPEAMLNFLMTLGWAAPIEREYGQAEQEIYSLDDFVSMFDPKDLNKASPVFNREKLVWYNQQYLTNAPAEELVLKLRNWLEFADVDLELKESLINDAQLAAKLALVQTRVKLLSEIPGMLKFFYARPRSDLAIDQLKRIPADVMQTVMGELADLIRSLGESASSWTHEQWESAMRALADKHEIKHGDLFMLLRVLIVGEPISPPLFESLQILGAEEVLSRISN